MKPSNIMIPEGGNFGVRSILTDFGIAVKKGTTPLTATGGYIGTEQYRAPETLKERAAPSFDNCGLALVAYKMITLRPFRETEDEPIREFNGGLGSGSLNRVFKKALNLDPKKRFDTCAEFINRLAKAAPPREAPETVFETRPYDIPQNAATAVKNASSRKWLWAVAAVPVVAAVGFFGFSGFGGASADASWTSSEQAIVNAFPGIVPSEPGASPWRGFTCKSATTDGADYASISCASRRGTVVIADFGDSRGRADYVSSNNAEVFSNGSCTIKRTAYGENNQATLPEGDKQQFAILVSGNNADDLSREVPLC